MQTNTIKVMTLTALCTVLASCTKSTSVCGAGESVQANGSSFCVYKGAIVIVGGFDCPASMSFRMDFENATVCGNHGFDNIDVPNDICARAFVPCTPIEDSDAGVPPSLCGGQVCDLPNATAACIRTECVLDTCDVGFGDCDADPADGCESSLNSLDNCGGCGVVCTAGCCDQGVCGACGADAGGRCVPIAELCDRQDNDCDLLIDEDCGAVADGGGACGAGFADCDGDSANGCETSLTTLSNCAACGVVCVGPSMTCSTGVCRVDTLP